MIKLLDCLSSDDKAHGALSQDDYEPVRVLNRMVGFYKMAPSR